jgi:hypothetical protein
MAGKNPFQGRETAKEEKMEMKSGKKMAPPFGKKKAKKKK